MHLLFREYRKDPSVAYFLPTPQFVVANICRPIDFNKDQTIIEYGAGTGAFAEYILNKMTKDSILIMIELNETLAKHTKEKFADDNRAIVAQGSAVEVKDIIKHLNIQNQITAVISGIPFSQLPESIGNSIAQHTSEILGPTNPFIVYQAWADVEHYLAPYFKHIQKSFAPMVRCQKSICNFPQYKNITKQFHWTDMINLINLPPLVRYIASNK